MAMVDVTVFYLEMLAPVRREVPPPRAGLTVERVASPEVGYYRALYDAVGKEFHWVSRRRMSDAELSAIISDPRVEMHVLHVDGRPAGFAELDCRRPDDIELVQFGLTSEFIGQGLGRWFLQWTIDHAWQSQPKRMWLHTCTHDHAVALPNYLKAGFVLFKEEAARHEL